MVAQCYQASFCSLNTVFIVKLNSISFLNHNFTIKTSFNFQFYRVKINLNHKIKLKCISNPHLSSKSIPNLNHKIN